MKNMSVSKKLMLGFLITTALCGFVGISGIIGMSKMNKSGSLLYLEQTEPLPEIAKTIEYIQLIRIHIRSAVLYSNDTMRLASIETDMLKCIEETESYMHKYGATIKDLSSLKAFNEAVDIFYNTVKPAVLQITSDVRSGEKTSNLLIKLDELKVSMDKMSDNFTLCMNNKVAGGEEANLESNRLYIKIQAQIIIAICLSIVISVILAVHISRMISRPLDRVCRFLYRFGAFGYYELSEENLDNLANRANDEIGMCQQSLYMVIMHLKDIGDVLSKIEKGDLTATLLPLSEDDTMGNAVNKVVESLNTMFGDLRVTSEKDTAETQAISQELAEGIMDIDKVINAINGIDESSHGIAG